MRRKKASRALPKLFGGDKMTAGRNEKENILKAQTKSAAISALKWAAGLSAGFIIGPTVVILAPNPGKVILAE